MADHQRPPVELAVIDLVAERYRANVRTAAKLTGEAERLFRYLRTAGIERWEDATSEVVLSWCWAARQTRPAFRVHGP